MSQLFTRSAGPILQPDSTPPWTSGAVFNPGAWYHDGTVHLLFRAIPTGYKISNHGRDADVNGVSSFKNYVTTIGYAYSRDAVNFTVSPNPFIAPDSEFDRFGVEDARISKIDDTFLITYTGLSQPLEGPVNGIRIALASTTDFQSVRKHGIVGPNCSDKDAVIFPRRIKGRIAMLHRITPDIQLIYFRDLDELFDPLEEKWASHMHTLEDHVIMRPQFRWEARKIGAGPTPIETSEGWLLIYHGVDEHHVYRMGLALLDLDDPSKVIARSSRPVLSPERQYERIGDVNNVVFPEGAVVIDDVLHMYYGAADKVIGYASASMSDVLLYLKRDMIAA